MTRSRWAWAVLGATLVAGGVAAWRWTRPPAAPDRPVVVVVSGDTAGWLVPCGCTANQSGGLPRRATYLRQLSEDADVLYGDAGGAAAGTSDYHRIKFEAVLRGELAMGVTAHNVGGPEAALGGDYLRRVSKELNVPFVSANVRDSAGMPVAESVRVVERSGLKVAITGVLSPRYASRSCVVEDPREAVLRVAAQVKGRTDRLVVLAYLPPDELRALAAELPEADAVVGGPTGQAMAPQPAGSTTFAAATNKGKFLVRLDGWRARALAGEVVELTPAYADDPDQQANVRRYLEELGDRDIPAANSGLAPPLPTRPPAGYRVAGSAACQQCHDKDCTSWAGSGHAHAWQTLADRGYHVDSYCQQCHTTGFGLPGGFESARRAGELHSVGCESCHGPSQAHVKNPKARTTFAARDQCATCHDRENSPTFAYDTFWPKVRHGEPAKPQRESR
jgi:Cytochrome c554 and c-prime